MRQYVPVTPAWSWNDGTPAERAATVRSHLRTLDHHAIQSLFKLSRNGVEKIAAGDIWRPEYETLSVTNDEGNHV